MTLRHTKDSCPFLNIASRHIHAMGPAELYGQAEMHVTWLGVQCMAQIMGRGLSRLHNGQTRTQGRASCCSPTMASSVSLLYDQPTNAGDSRKMMLAACQSTQTNHVVSLSLQMKVLYAWISRQNLLPALSRLQKPVLYS